jgi:hypothetical protein
MEINPTERKDEMNDDLEIIDEEDLEAVGWFDLGGKR